MKKCLCIALLTALSLAASWPEGKQNEIGLAAGMSQRLYDRSDGSRTFGYFLRVDLKYVHYILPFLGLCGQGGLSFGDFLAPSIGAGPVVKLGTIALYALGGYDAGSNGSWYGRVGLDLDLSVMDVFLEAGLHGLNAVGVVLGVGYPF